MNSKLISVILPGLNEAENLNELRLRLESLTRKLDNYSFEFIFIDNGSEDNTRK